MQFSTAHERPHSCTSCLVLAVSPITTISLLRYKIFIPLTSRFSRRLELHTRSRSVFHSQVVKVPTSFFSLLGFFLFSFSFFKKNSKENPRKMVYTISGIRLPATYSARRPSLQSSFNGDRRSTSISFLLKKNLFSRIPLAFFFFSFDCLFNCFHLNKCIFSLISAVMNVLYRIIHKVLGFTLPFILSFIRRMILIGFRNRAASMLSLVIEVRKFMADSV